MMEDGGIFAQPYKYDPEGLYPTEQAQVFHIEEYPENLQRRYEFIVGDEFFFLYTSRNGTKYNFKTSQWTDLYSGKMVSNNAVWIEAKDGKIWFLGRRALGTIYDVFDDTKFYDPKTDTISDGPTLPKNTFLFGLVRISSNEIFITGGWSDTGWTKNSYIYNEDSQSFLPRNDMLMACYGGAIEMVIEPITRSKKILYVGGSCQDYVWTNIYIYDLKGNDWSQASFSLPTGVVFSCHLSRNNKMVLLGGIKYHWLSGLSDQVYEVTLTGVEVLEALPSPVKFPLIHYPKSQPNN